MFWLAGIIGAVLVIGYGWYATLIARRNKVREALGSVDTHLQKRHDLIPAVLKVARRFMEHERDLMEKLTTLRTKVQQPYDVEDPEQVRRFLETSTEIQGVMGRLFAVAENYPNLRSSEQMVTAQHAYIDVEDNLAAARRFYNAAVNALNNAVEIFPGSMIAAASGVSTMPFYEVEDEEARKPIDADAYLR